MFIIHVFCFLSAVLRRWRGPTDMKISGGRPAVCTRPPRPESAERECDAFEAREREGNVREDVERERASGGGEGNVCCVTNGRRAREVRGVRG